MRGGSPRYSTTLLLALHTLPTLLLAVLYDHEQHLPRGAPFLLPLGGGGAGGDDAERARDVLPTQGAIPR